MKVSPDLSSSVCHHPSVRKYHEDCGLCPGLDDDAGYSLRFPDVRRIHLHVRSDNGSCAGRSGRCHHASLGILSSMLGFDENAQALMIALYIAMDSFGTACNVTGDGALALLIDKWFGKSKRIFPVHPLKTDRNPTSYNSATYEKQTVALSHVQGL